MGFDITYHPITETEVKTFWFDLLTRRTALLAIQRQVADDEGAGDYLASLVKEAKRGGVRGDLNGKHLFPLAIVAGIIRPYWYIRGGAFSLCVAEDPSLAKYLTSWRELVPAAYRKATISDTLAANDTVGCFLGAKQVGPLREAIRRKQIPAKVLDRAFSHGRLAVFLRALHDAAKHGRGLLEASDVVVPNPLGDDWHQCLTNADHCQGAGITLYRKAAAAQLRKVAKPAAKTSPSKRPSRRTVGARKPR